MEPLVSRGGFNLSPEAILACALFGILVGVIGVTFRRTLLAVVDELAAMGRSAGSWLLAAVLRRRPGGAPTTPWFCAVCRSQNQAWAKRCYSCDARRSEAEAPEPDAEPPAGPSAGRTQRR